MARFEQGKGIIEGSIVVSETITSDFYFNMYSKRCNIQRMTQCSLFADRNITELCSQLQNNIWLNLSKFTKPPLKCPLKSGTYAFQNAIVDLAQVSLLPLEGYLWKTKFTIYQLGGNNPQPLGCFLVNVKITENRKRSRG